jgi:hypothetical protein
MVEQRLCADALDPIVADFPAHALQATMPPRCRLG